MLTDSDMFSKLGNLYSSMSLDINNERLIDVNAKVHFDRRRVYFGNVNVTKASKDEDNIPTVSPHLLHCDKHIPL